MKNKVVTFGEILLRFSKPDCLRLSQGNRFIGKYGGSEANVAVGLAMQGDEVDYVSAVPDNDPGRAARQSLQEFGVGTRHILTHGDRLGTYYFEEAAGMRNSRVAYDRAGSSFSALEPGMIDWREAFKDAAVFHCSGITCAISRGAAEATFEGVRIADEMGLTISCDINYRKNLWKYPGADPHGMLCELMSYSDIIFGDAIEWYVVSGHPQVPFTAISTDYEMPLQAYQDWLDAIHEQFPRCARTLIGIRNQVSSNHHTLTGVLLADEKMYHTRIIDIPQIVDPMGVGDAFAASMIHSHLHWPDDKQRFLDYSLAAAALKGTIPGDFNLSTEEEILAVMNGEATTKALGRHKE